MDLTKAAQVVNNREIRPFELYLFIAIVYWICTYSMSRYARSWRRGSALPETVLPSGRAPALAGGRRPLAGLRWCGSTGARSRIPPCMLPTWSPSSTAIHALLPDTRGHGLSQKLRAARGLHATRQGGRDLLLWLDTLGVPAAVWGGASMGGALSLWVAAHHARRVRGRRLDQRTALCPARVGSALVGRPPAAGRRRPLRRLLRRQRAAADGRGGPGPAQGASRALRRAAGEPAAALGGLAPRAPRRDLSRPEWLADCAGIRCPVQIVAGERTTSPPWRCPAAWPRRFPAPACTWWRSGPHFPNRSHRAEVQQVMDTFLSSLGI